MTKVVQLLIYAAIAGNEKIVKMLLDNGADVNSKAPISNTTALGFIIQQENTKLINMLIRYGADLEALIARRFFALDAEWKKMNTEFFELFEKRGNSTRIDQFIKVKLND